MAPTFTPSTARWLAPLLLLLGGLCLTAIWVLLALYLGRQVNWMAWLGAIDAAMLLRFGGMRAGAPRIVLAMLATLIIAVLANWFIIASQLGFAFGLMPWDSAVRLGPEFAWTRTRLANGPIDAAQVLLARLLAAWLAK